MAVHERDVENEGGRAQSHQQQSGRLEPPNGDQNRWKDEIELLFNAERPEMEQRFASRWNVKIAGLRIVQNVARECSCRHGMPAKRRIVAWQHCKVAQSKDNKQDRKQCGKEPSNATTVEVEEAERLIPKTAQDKARYQETRDYEEDIDANKPSAKQFRIGMKCHNSEHRKRT